MKTIFLFVFTIALDCQDRLAFNKLCYWNAAKGNSNWLFIRNELIYKSVKLQESLKKTSVVLARFTGV